MNQPTNKNQKQSSRANSGSSDSIMNRVMPESLEAEAAVLGSMIIDPECIGEVVQELKTESFYRHSHRFIFEALVALFEHSPTIDGVLLRNELKKQGRSDDVGGPEYLVKLAESVPSAANVMYYVKIVKEKQLMRDLVQASSDILNEAYLQEGDTDRKLDEAEQKIFDITNKKISGNAESLKNLVVKAYEQIEKREGKHVTGLGTGYYELDDITSGLQKGEMIIIAGRPSMGKTSFAMNLAENIGIEEQKAIAIFSLEMGRQQLAERFLCSVSRVDAQRVRKGMLEAEQYRHIAESVEKLKDTKIFIDDSPGLSPLEIRAKARRLKSQHDIQCIIVDYLQLMSSGVGRVESRQQEITMISRYLQSLAREIDVPVMVLSQLNRGPEAREDHRPRMSDLCESGSIEQDADVVMLLHREDYYHRGQEDYQEDNTAEIIIAKQRNGPTGTIKLTFMEQFTRFENASSVREPF